MLGITEGTAKTPAPGNMDGAGRVFKVLVPRKMGLCSKWMFGVKESICPGDFLCLIALTVFLWYDEHHKETVRSPAVERV